MFFLKSWLWLQGQVLIRVQGPGAERLLNRCLARGIYLWDIRRADDLLYFRLSSRAFLRLRPLVRGLGVRVRILEKTGLPFFLVTFKRRRMLAAGGVIFLFLLYLWSNCIWSIRVQGVGHEAQRAELEQTLIAQGVTTGIFKDKLDLPAIEHEVLTAYPELAWARAYFIGTRFVLEVVPKLPPPELSLPGHLAARKNGLILDILVLAGKPLVEKGMSVRAGEVLVLGDQGHRPVAAKGRVLARVWHEAYKEGEPLERFTLRSGRIAESRVLSLFGRELFLSGVRQSPFSRCDQVEKRKNVLPWRNSNRVVEIKERTYYELKEMQRRLPPDEYARRLSDQVLAELKKELSEGSKVQQVDKKVLSMPGDSIVRVWVRIEAVEDIAVPIPYYPQNREGGSAIGGADGDEDPSHEF